MSVDAAIRDFELPRENGELVFDTPWASRAFGMAVALHEQGAYEWEVFRDRLVAQIATHEPDDGSNYYERWLDGLEQLLVDTGVVTEADIAARAVEIAEHDDHHDHH